MHRHNAHFVAVVLLEIAFDLRLLGGHPMQKTLERRCLRVFVVQR